MIPLSALTDEPSVTISAGLVRASGGINEAAIASLIFQHTRPGASYAVSADDGELWFPASAELMSDWIGLSQFQVRRAIENLFGDGHIRRRKLRVDGIGFNTYSYRLEKEHS